MVWKITFTTLGDLPWMLLFLLCTCETAYRELPQCQHCWSLNFSCWEYFLTFVKCWCFLRLNFFNRFISELSHRQTVWSQWPGSGPTICSLIKLRKRPHSVLLQNGKGIISLLSLTLWRMETPIDFGKQCEDPDEMQNNAAFHQDLHCLQRQNRSSHVQRNKYINFSETTGITCDPSIYTMDLSDFLVCSFMENSIGP